MFFKKSKYIILSGISIVLLASWLTAQYGTHRIAQLDYEFSGCFGGSKASLIIYENSGTTFASVQTGAKTMTVRLDQKQLDYFHQFASELKKLDGDGMCTSVETYRLTIGISTIYKVDASCDWDGFQKLWVNFFHDNK